MSATSSPNASSSGSTSPAIIPRNEPICASTSSRVLPVTVSVIIEAELWLIEHPCPTNDTSRTLPPSSCTYTVISSPQSGLFFEQDSSASGIARLFRGFL